MKTSELKAQMAKSKGEYKEPEKESAQEEQAENVQNNPHPIEQLVARVFASRNAAHREHIKTKSYAQHVALGSFYDAIIGKVDEIIETDQGMYGLIGDFSVEDVKPTDFAKFVREEAIWMETNRDKFSKCEATLALVDELTAIYLQAAYKLTNLA
jgi:hypothetical protein